MEDLLKARLAKYFGVEKSKIMRLTDLGDKVSVMVDLGIKGNQKHTLAKSSLPIVTPGKKAKKKVLPVVYSKNNGG